MGRGVVWGRRRLAAPRRICERGGRGWTVSLIQSRLGLFKDRVEISGDRLDELVRRVVESVAEAQADGYEPWTRYADAWSQMRRAERGDRNTADSGYLYTEVDRAWQDLRSSLPTTLRATRREAVPLAARLYWMLYEDMGDRKQ